MKAHVFYYRWPGIKEGLTHLTRNPPDWVDTPDILEHRDIPSGAYIFMRRWYQVQRVKAFSGSGTAIKHLPLEDHQVPAIFRTHLLIDP